MPLSVAIYARISRDLTGEELGVQRQLQDCRELAAKWGWAVGAEYVDNDRSAYSGKPRPEYLRMLADLKSGARDAVIAWHTDRLHRQPSELETYIDVCEAVKAETRTVRSGALDLATPQGRMVARRDRPGGEREAKRSAPAGFPAKGGAGVAENQRAEALRLRE